MKGISAAFWPLLVAVSLASCTTAEPYFTKLGATADAEQKLPGPVTPEPNNHCDGTGSCIAIVEFDDYGNAMNRAQLLGAVAAAEEQARRGATILVYVHGWHENAKPDAEDLQSFRELLGRTTAWDKTLRQNEGFLTKGRVFGIYVAWRGDSISKNGVTMPASYLLTFWDRKDAAQRIGGSGGVYELVRRLSEIRAHNDSSRLVFEGHSFGGALLYSALSNRLVDQIFADAAVAAPAPASASSAATSPPPTLLDLVVLINPAFEAMRLEPQFDLARSFTYPNGPTYLPPRLVIITSKADDATAFAFPAGRDLGTLTAAYPQKADWRALNTTAVGHYVPLITHELILAPGGQCPADSRADIMDLQTHSLCITAPAGQSKIPALLMVRCDHPGDCKAATDSDHYIVRGAVDKGYVPERLPIVNMRTVAPIVRSHTDIWQVPFQNFLAQLASRAVRDPASIPTLH